MNPLKTIQKQRRFRQRQKEYRLAQGRLTTEEAAAQLAGDASFHLCTVQSPKGDALPIGMQPQPYGSHLLLVAPLGSNWGEQLTYTLVQWADAALVMDVGGNLHARTASFREKVVGPVYTLPGYKLNLGHYYRFWDETQARKLHGYLMPPYPPEDRRLVERSVALFTAVGHYAYAHKRNLMHVLLDVAACDMLMALKGLETIPYARLCVRRFTKGQSPQEAIHDSGLVQAFSLFARQLQRYQQQYALFDTEPAIETIPHHWALKKGTIYLTYDLESLAETGGVAIAVIAGLIRDHFSHGRYQKLLLVVDTAMAEKIPRFSTLLRMAGDYGVTVLLHAPSWQALHAVAGAERDKTFASRFLHQLWYPPRDVETAQQMSALLGNRLCLDSDEKEAVLSVEEILAWPKENTLVILQRERSYRFIGQRLTLPFAHFHCQPPLLSPVSAPAPRNYLDWMPALPAPEQEQMPIKNQKKLPQPTKTIIQQQENKQPKQKKKQGWK